MNATALWTPDRCEVWCPTQNGEAALAACAEAAGLPPQQCDVHKVHLGGGFGRRGAVQDYVRQAVAIAKQMPGTPVKLIWSREEDMLHGALPPDHAVQADRRARREGQPRRRCTCASPASRSSPASRRRACRRRAIPASSRASTRAAPKARSATRIPNLLIDHAMRNPHVPPGFWRGVNLNQNAIYLECFIDELAHAAGKDPLEFRRKLMANHPKHLAVLNAVAEKRRLGQAGRRPGVYPRPGADHGLRQLCRGVRRGLGQRRTAS